MNYQLDLFSERPPPPKAIVPAASAVSLIRPRLYQVEAVGAAWHDLYVEQLQSTMLLMATGTGKTVTFATLCKKGLAEGLKRILILVHRDELVWQAKRMIEAVCTDVLVEVEGGDRFAERAAQVGVPRSKVVIGMKDSLWLDYRLKSFNRDEFDLIVVDECHHCIPQNKTYWNIILWFQTAKLIGVTATADRTDELALGMAYKNVAYEYDILTAINDGWLVPIVQQYETVTGYDLSGLKSFKSKSDFSDAEIARHVTKEKPLHGLAEACVKYSNWGGEERPTLVFCASVNHAKSLAEILNRRHYKDGSGRAVSITNDQFADINERRKVIDAYRMGEYRYIVNYGILTEGFDAAETRVVVIGRVTKSRMLYAQMAGRGLRTSGSITDPLGDAASSEQRKALIRASTKPSCLLVDPVGNSGVHKLVVSSADLLGGHYEDEVVEMAKQRTFEKGGRSNINHELREAKRILEDRESRRRQDLIITATTTSRTVDPFDLADVVVGREPGWFKGKEPTQRMREMLERNGYTSKMLQGMSFWKAKKIIEDIISRKEKGLATINQLQLLAKHGYEVTKETTFKEASKLIEGLKANNWRRPDR